MALSIGTALKQLDSANHQQESSDVSEETDIAKTVDKRDHTDGNENGGPHQALSATALTSTAGGSAHQSPTRRPQPESQHDQQQRPYVMEAKLEQTRGAQEEKNSEQYQDDRACWDLAGVRPVAGTTSGKCLAQAKWVWSGLAHLDGARGPYTIDDLVNVEESDSQAAHYTQHLAATAVAGTDPRDEQAKNHKMSQSLRVLA